MVGEAGAIKKIVDDWKHSFARKSFALLLHNDRNNGYLEKIRDFLYAESRLTTI
jgi:hypothetical protein